MFRCQIRCCVMWTLDIRNSHQSNNSSFIWKAFTSENKETLPWKRCGKVIFRNTSQINYRQRSRVQCKSPRRALPCKSDGGARHKISRTPLRYQNLVLWACPKFISTPERYQFYNNKFWHCKFNSNKDNFLTLSSEGLFESIFINLYPNKAYQLWQQAV